MKTNTVKASESSENEKKTADSPADELTALRVELKHAENAKKAAISEKNAALEAVQIAKKEVEKTISLAKKQQNLSADERIKRVATFEVLRKNYTRAFEKSELLKQFNIAADDSTGRILTLSSETQDIDDFTIFDSNTISDVISLLVAKMDAYLKAKAVEIENFEM
jgi:hypothetical protein